MSDLHAVFATTIERDRMRVTDALTWDQAQFEWNRLDNLRRSNRFPHVRYFEVRSMDDPNYCEAPVSIAHCEPVIATRGYSTAEAAARKAWSLWQGSHDRRGIRQGSGGWYFWRNGRPAAQGMQDLARFARTRGLIAKGVNGKWYPLVSNLDDRKGA